MGGTLETIAKDVKIQVEFNPSQAAFYRLIGYENRLLAAQDFNDDTKDAGEIGAGHSITALYEVVPVGVETAVSSVDRLKYQDEASLADAGFSGELLTVKLRYKEPEGSVSRLIEISVSDPGTSFDAASENLRFAASVAAFGMLLRDSKLAGKLDAENVYRWAFEACGLDLYSRRLEFLRLVDKVRILRRERADDARGRGGR